MPLVNHSYPSIDQTKQFFLSNPVPGLTKQVIDQAFYLSKQTIVNESEMANYEYTYLHWPEFIEFIARLAELKYQNGMEDVQWPLKKKISVLLSFLLKFVGERRKNPPELVEVISESDDDY